MEGRKELTPAEERSRGCEVARIELVQEDRQYWRAIIPTEDGKELHVSIQPDGLGVDLVDPLEARADGVIDGTWQEWGELSAALRRVNVGRNGE